MAFSETGMGKTFFALNVAYAVATGGAYLGWQQVQARQVYVGRRARHAATAGLIQVRAQRRRENLGATAWMGM